MVLYVDVAIDVGERRGENEFAIGRIDRSISWSPSEIAEAADRWTIHDRVERDVP